MADLNQNYTVITNFFSTLAASTNKTLDNDTLRQAIQQQLANQNIVPDAAHTESGDFELTPSLLKAVGQDINVPASSFSDDQLSQSINQFVNYYQQMQAYGVTLLSAADPRNSHHELFTTLSSDNDINAALPLIGINSNSLSQAFLPTPNGDVHFNNGMVRTFVPDNASGDGLTFSFSMYNGNDAQKLTDFANQSEIERRGINESMTSGEDEKLEDQLTNSLGVYLTDNDLKTIVSIVKANPSIKYSTDTIERARQELKAVYNTGKSFSINAGTQLGQFDIKVDGATKVSDRLLDMDSDGHDSKYIGNRTYTTDIGPIYRIGQSAKNKTVPGQVFNFSTGVLSKDPKTGYYTGLKPNLSFKGSSSLYFNNQHFYLAPLANRDPASKKQHKFLNNLKTDYSSAEGTQVVNFYSAQARQQYLVALGDDLDSADEDVNNSQNAINKYMGMNGAVKSYLPHQFRVGDLANETTTDDIQKTISFFDDADEFKKQSFNEAMYQSVQAQLVASRNLEATDKKFGFPHEVDPNLIADADKAHQSFMDFKNSLDDNQKADLDDFVSMINEHADHTIGALSDDPDKETIEANRVQDFADQVNVISVKNDLLDGLSKSPISNHLIGPEFSQNMIKDRLVQYDNQSGRTIKSLSLQGYRLHGLFNIISSQAAESIKNFDVEVDASNTLRFVGLDRNDNLVSGVYDGDNLQQQLQEAQKFNAQSYDGSIPFDDNSANSVDDFINTSDNPEVTKKTFDKISKFIALNGSTSNNSVKNVELKIDDNNNIQFTGVEQARVNGELQQRPVKGTNSLANWSILLQNQKNFLNQGVKNARENSIPFDESSRLDMSQVNSLRRVLVDTQNYLFNGLNIYGNGFHNTPVQYRNSIKDANGNPVFDENGVRKVDTGINPNGMRNSRKVMDAQGRTRNNYPDVRIDKNGILQYDGYRTIGKHNAYVKDEHGVDILYTRDSHNQLVPIQPGPQLTTSKNGTPTYSYSKEQIDGPYTRQPVENANYIPGVRTKGHIGQIFVPNAYRILNTNFNSGANYSRVNGSRAFMTDQGVENGFNTVSLADQLKVESFNNQLLSSIRQAINGQVLKSPVNLPDDGSTLADHLEAAPDEHGNIKNPAKLKAIDISNSTDSTTINTLYHGDAYGERLPDDFWDFSALPSDLKVATVFTLNNKVRFPNELRQFANSSVESASDGFTNANSRNNKLAAIYHGKNFRIHQDELDGVLDVSTTGSGQNQGISNFLVQGAKVLSNGHVVPANSNSVEANRAAILNTPYFKYQSGTPADRLQMAGHQALTAMRVDKDTYTLLSNFGGYTFDDGNVISKEFAERNAINLNGTKNKGLGPTDETIAWFNHELDQFMKDGTNLGARDWGPKSKSVLSQAASYKQALEEQQTQLHDVLAQIPDQEIDADKAAVPDIQNKVKLSLLRKDIKALANGEPTKFDVSFVAQSGKVISHLDTAQETFDAIVNKYGTTRPLKAGDKLSNFAGNKGIISLVVDRNMAPDKAKQLGLEKEVAIFKENPQLDKIESPNSVTSRNNMSLTLEMMDKGDAKPVTINGKTVGQMGKLDTIVTDIFADSKTHVYNGNSQGRKFSGQLIWGLQQHNAHNVIKEAFSHNNRSWHDYREYLLATGYDMSAMGDYQVGYHPHIGENRKIFELGDADKDVNNLSKVIDSKDFFRKMGNSGGFLKLPFSIKLHSGYTTDKLPVLSANLRKNTKQVDDKTIINDYTNEYSSIVDAAQDFVKASQPDYKVDDTHPTADAIKESIEAQIAKVQNKVIDNELGGQTGATSLLKKSFVRQNMIAKRLQNSATAVWSPDSRVDLDTVKVSPAIYEAIGPKDKNGELIPYDPETGRPSQRADFRTMLWRDPVLHGGSIRSFKIQVDPNITGVAINPVNDNPFDGDFDGDTVGLMRFESPAAQKDLEQMSVPNNLIAPHSKDIPQKDQVSELNCSMDFVAGFYTALKSHDGEGRNRINNALGRDLTPEEMKLGLGDENNDPKPKKLLNKVLVEIATNYPAQTAFEKSMDITNLGMRDYNYGSVVMDFESRDKTLEAIQFQQNIGIKGKPGKKPVQVRAMNSVVENGKRVDKPANNPDGSPKYTVDWVTPIDETTGEIMNNYKGFSPKLEPKLGDDGIPLTDNEGHAIPKRDKDGHAIPVRDNNGDIVLQSDNISIDGKTFRAQPSSVGKCDIYLSGLKDKKNDAKYGDAFANLSKQIQKSMGIKTDDTGYAGAFSQRLFSALRTIDPTAALELTYPITQGTLQVKHDDVKALMVHESLNKSLRNLYDGHDRDYNGMFDYSKENKAKAKISADKWIDEIQDVYENELSADFDIGFAKKIAKSMSDSKGFIISTSDLMDSKAAQIDRTSFGSGIETIDNQAKSNVNVMGPSNDDYNAFIKANGAKSFNDISSKKRADFLRQSTSANDMRPADVEKYIELVSDNADNLDAIKDELLSHDVTLSNHGKEFDTQVSDPSFVQPVNATVSVDSTNLEQSEPNDLNIFDDIANSDDELNSLLSNSSQVHSNVAGSGLNAIDLSAQSVNPVPASTTPNSDDSNSSNTTNHDDKDAEVNHHQVVQQVAESQATTSHQPHIESLVAEKRPEVVQRELEEKAKAEQHQNEVDNSQVKSIVQSKSIDR